jgi:hypothetical protein
MKTKPAGLTASMILFPVIILIFSGCRWAREETIPGPVTDITVMADGAVVSGDGIAVNRGGELTLTAILTPRQDSARIAWEVSGDAVKLTGPGTGAAVTVRGNTSAGDGPSEIKVIAWKNSADAPVEKTFPVSLREAPVSGVILMEGDSPAPLSLIIGIGEERRITAKITPSFALSNAVWTVGNAYILGLTETAPYTYTISGIAPGKTTLRVEAANGNTAVPVSALVEVEVRTPQPIEKIEILNGTEAVSGILRIGLYEELALHALVSPEDAVPVLTWRSDNGAAVQVDVSGRIKGLQGASTAVISVEAANSVTGAPLSAQVTVEVKNPVTGLRVQYDNSEGLPVPAMLHLSPGDAVDLKAALAPAGVSGSGVTWSGGGGAFELSTAQGPLCTVTGTVPGSGEIIVTAANADTGEPASAVFSVRVAPQPVWAWDRGRDGGLAGDIPSNDNTLTLAGRGEHNTPVRIRASGNLIGYTPSGLDINSYATGNSTRLMVGTNSSASTAGGHQSGDFDFLTPSRPIRISVDYEIVKSAPPARDLWLTVNNNQPTQGASVLGSTARILVQPLTALEGTKATATGYLNIPNIPDGPGRDSLQNAFVGIICLSNGGRIYVSGIRIEYDDEQTGAED